MALTLTIQERFPFTVICPLAPFSMSRARYEWCVDFYKHGTWTVAGRDHPGTIFRFQSKNDAILFALKWS